MASCSTHGEMQKTYDILLENVKEDDHLEDLRINERKI
jgi:hypothetical protein